MAWDFSPRDFRAVYLERHGWDTADGSTWIHEDIGYWTSLEDALDIQREIGLLSWPFSLEN